MGGVASNYGGDGGCQYITSVPGILKMIELLCDLLTVILGAAAPTLEGASGHKGFFLFVAILSLIITVVLFVICITTLRRKWFNVPWWLIEFVWCVFIALFYFIASIVIATIANRAGVYGAATFFGFAAFIAYVAEAIVHFFAGRSNTQSGGGGSDPQYSGSGRQAQYDATVRPPIGHSTMN